MFDENIGTFIENAAFVVRSILFAKLPKDKKVEFLTEAGQQYCALRRAMARTTLTHVEQDKFKRFKAPTDNEQPSTSPRGKKDRRIPRPF